MTVTIGRRELLAALGGAAVVWPLGASRHQSDHRTGARPEVLPVLLATADQTIIG
jgi:hypothetical protein